jgi:hypothetical protein
MLDVSDHHFVNLGIGYQHGSQKASVLGNAVDVKTRFVRIVIGAGGRL